jgi:ferric-dicitrate binding protein FerR (iron transport regulator)
MNQDNLHLLVKKFVNGTASTEEELALLNWYRNKSEEEILWEADLSNEEELVRQRMLSNILKNTQAPARLRHLKWYIAAAAVLLIGVITTVFTNRVSVAPLPLIVKSNKLIVKPGTNAATLMLANGSKILLDQSSKGVLAQQGGISIKKTAGGQLVYDLSGKSTADAKSIGFNTLTTARGQQYQVILPDGTKVWLNAASSLRFPTAFTGADRQVELHGEAYFEVAKNKDMPFRVSVNKTEVEVLGTHFNIMGYPEEGTTNTTLLEGSVKVIKDNTFKIIKPGQQAQVKTGIEVAEVNASKFVTWTKGDFSFDDEDIHTLMNQIARWYDVDVYFEPGVTNEKFGGMVSRYKDVTQILKKLELTNTIHFKLEGRRITVMK